jgi:hypothetical protein
MRIAVEIVNLGRSTRSATWRPRNKIGGLLLFFILGAPIYQRIQAGTDCLKGCSKNEDVPKSSLFQSAAMVPIGRHNFSSRRRFVPRVPFPRASGPGALATAHRRSIEEERRMQVVRDNNVDQALKVLKKKMRREGVSSAR